MVWGCVGQVGDQSSNIGRFAVLAAGWPRGDPGHHDQPGVRVEPAGARLRASQAVMSGPVRRRHRGRRRGDEPGAARRGAGRRACPTARRPGPLRRLLVQPGHQRGDDRASGGASRDRSSTSTRRGRTSRPPRRSTPAPSTSQIVPVSTSTATAGSTSTRASAPRHHRGDARRAQALLHARTASSTPATPRRSPTARPRCWS